MTVTTRDWLQETFTSERVHGLHAPWVLHTGLVRTLPRPASCRR